jgi:hypothetical protein
MASYFWTGVPMDWIDPGTGQSVRLNRVQRTSDGLIGGWIESTRNLSFSGSCFVYDEAKVFGLATVRQDAHVSGDARVWGKSDVYGNAQVTENAEVVDSEMSGGLLMGNAVLINTIMTHGTYSSSVLGSMSTTGAPPSITPSDIIKPLMKEYKCECGAHKVGIPNFCKGHSHWCPVA